MAPEELSVFMARGGPMPCGFVVTPGSGAARGSVCSY